MANNTTRIDPTRTTALRDQFQREMKSRWGIVKRRIVEVIAIEDALGLNQAIPLHSIENPIGNSELLRNANPQRWRFLTDAGKLQAYQTWFQQQVDQSILEPTDKTGKPWASKYVHDAYTKGLVHAYAEENKNAKALGNKDFYAGGQQQFLKDAFGQGVATGKTQLLSTRTYEQLKGVSAAMSQEMARTLSAGMAAGHNPKKIAKALTDNVDGLTRKRALVIARTEVIHAHAEGALDAYEAMGVDELGIVAEWTTARDSAVCPQCGALQGQVFTVKQARGLIPRHPNCRCSWAPYTPKSKDKKALLQKGKEAAAASVAVEAKPDKSKWLGADLPQIDAEEQLAKDAARKAIAEAAAKVKLEAEQKAKAQAEEKQFLADAGLPSSALINGKLSLDAQYSIYSGPSLGLEDSTTLKDLDYKGQFAFLKAKQTAIDEANTAKNAAKNAAWNALSTKEDSVELQPLAPEFFDYDSAGWSNLGRKSYGMVLFNDSGKILLRQPTGNFDGYAWTFAKGGMDKGESPAEAAQREVFEETGYKESGIVGLIPGGFKGGTSTVHMFLGKAGAVDYDKLADIGDETASTKWVTPEEAYKLIQQTTNKIGKKRDLEILAAAIKEHSKITEKGDNSFNVEYSKAQKKWAAHKIKEYEAAQSKAAQIKSEQEAAEKEAKKKKHGDAVKAGKAKAKAAKLAAAQAQAEADAKAAQLTKDEKAKAQPMKPVGGLPSLADLTKVKDLPGSTRPTLEQDGDGNLWVVKRDLDPEHVRSEALADLLYRTAGVPVPRSGIIESDGGPVKVSTFLEGGQTLAAWLPTATEAERKAMYKEISRDFVVDALLGNWDVAGLGNDNIFIKGGVPYRIDNGGALEFRAQGSKKGSKWGPTVIELQTLRDKSINPNTAAIFADLTDADIREQIDPIFNSMNDILNQVQNKELRDTLEARIRFIKAAYAEPPRVASGSAAAEYGITKGTAARVKSAKVNGVTVSTDRDEIEDTNTLVWEEKNRLGEKQTKLWLKTTLAGSKKIESVLGPSLKTGAATSSGPNPYAAHHNDAYWGDIIGAAKSVNYHLGDGNFNDSKLKLLDAAEKEIKELLPKWALVDEDSKLMGEYYLDIIKKIKNAKDTKTPTGVLSQFTPPPPKPKAQPAAPSAPAFKVTRVTSFTTPVKKFDLGEAAETLDQNNFSGSYYLIDLGDGITARFTPREDTVANQEGLAFQGVLELTVPNEVSNESLQRANAAAAALGLNMDPPTPEYEELLYLHRSIYMNKKHTNSDYKKIFESKSLSDKEKVVQIKEFVKDVMKIDVDSLPPEDYNPRGISKNSNGSGMRVWERWDLPRSRVAREMKGHVLIHTSGDLYDGELGPTVRTLDGILNSGGEFTSTTERVRKGVSVNSTGGASSSSDIRSGGGSYFFTRIRDGKKNMPSTAFVFNVEALARQDVISYSGDNFGAVNRLDDRNTSIREWQSVAYNMGNEAIFKGALGLDDLKEIRVGSLAAKKQVLEVFKKYKVTHLPNGTPVGDVVVVSKS